MAIAASAAFILWTPSQTPASTTTQPPTTTAAQLRRWPTIEDLDSDGISSAQEILYGLNPKLLDSDSDGIPDNVERFWNLDVDDDGLVCALDVDSDGDGLVDGQEDKNKNGEIDTGETDPCNVDTDKDLLSDMMEIYWSTNPLVVDTDGDGLLDGLEWNWNSDTDNDGIINALDVDSDGDSLLDGQEVEIGTSPVEKDTDHDLVDDDEEIRIGTNPLDADSDDDGLLDGQEAAEGSYWSEAESLAGVKVVADLSASDGQAIESAADGTAFEGKTFGTLPAGTYKYLVKVKSVSSSSNFPRLTLTVSNGANVSDVHWIRNITANEASNPGIPKYLPVKLGKPELGIENFRGLLLNPGATAPVNVYRWYSTPEFELAGASELTLGARVQSGDLVWIDKILLIKMNSINARLTDPLDPDTDGDGLLDGEETAVKGYWYEAEDFAISSAQILNNENAGNGKEITQQSDSDLICEISDDSFTYAKGRYQLYVRVGKGPDASENLKLKIDITAGGASYTRYLVITGLYEWRLADEGGATFEMSSPGNITLRISKTSSEPNQVVYIDRVFLHSLIFNEEAFKQIQSNETFEESLDGADQFIMYNFGSWGTLSMTYGRTAVMNVPGGITDPMNPDTDEDGYRALDGGLEGSKGYLTDGKESDTGTNPFDVDTDDDGIPDGIDYNPLSDDSDEDGLLDGIEDSCKTWDGVDTWGINDTPEDPDYTDFLDDDTDDDGLLDGSEDRNANAFKDIGETSPNSADSDSDGINDGVELGLANPEGKNTSGWSGDADPATRTNPLDADTDDDNLLDGQEDMNKNGKVDSGETNPCNPDTDGDGLKDGIDPNPLVPDYPDLSISAEEIVFDPTSFFNTEGTRISATIHNDGFLGAGNKWIYIGFYDGDPDNGGKPIGWESILSIGAGETKLIGITIWGEAMWWWQTAGRHDIFVKILTQSGATYPVGYPTGSTLEETSYANNKASRTAVAKGPPTADAGPDQGIQGRVLDGDEVQFFGKGSDPDGSIVKYEWDFEGDGFYDWSSASTGSTKYVYVAEGLYTAILRVTDDSGYTATDEAQISVTSRGLDSDGDGLSDIYEQLIGSDPNNGDTDGDGLYDDFENSAAVAYGLTSLDDIDNDGLINLLDPDSDGDGLLDGDEVYLVPTSSGYVWTGTNPYYFDTDYDGLGDSEETSTSSFDPDTDSDGLNDYDEVKIYKTNPNNRDTDDDGISDGVDLSPKLKPAAPTWTDQFLPGMLRFSQEYEVSGIDGRSEIWVWAWDHAVFLQDAGNNGTRASSIGTTKVYNTINEYWDYSDYTAISATYKYDWTQEDAIWKRYGPDAWHPKGYKLIYDRLIYYYDVAFKNKKNTTTYDADFANFSYALQEIAVQQNRRQSIIVQFSLPYYRDSYSYVSDGLYTMPVFLYNLYRSNNFYDDSNLPVYTNLAVATELESNSYEIDMRIPENIANQSTLYLQIMPVWVTKNNKGTTRWVLPTEDIIVGALGRRVFFSENEWMTFTYDGIDDLASAIPSKTIFNSPDFLKSDFAVTIKKLKEEGEEGAYEATASITTKKMLDTAGAVCDLTSGIIEVLNSNKLADMWEELADISRTMAEKYSDLADAFESAGDLEMAEQVRAEVARDLRAADEFEKAADGLGKYNKVSNVVSGASIGIVLATDGVQAVTAVKEGDEIKFTMYAAKTSLGVLKEVSGIQSLAAKSGSLKWLGSAKGQAVLTIGIGLIQAGIDIYDSTKTNDQIVKLKCYESAAANVIDACISAVPKYGQIIEGSWIVTVTILSYAFPDEIASEVCSTPGSAITFMFEYQYLPTVIPSQIAEAAYNFAATEECKRINKLNEWGIPAIFIQPD